MQKKKFTIRFKLFRFVKITVKIPKMLKGKKYIYCIEIRAHK